jgi:hypothetical protein
MRVTGCLDFLNTLIGQTHENIDQRVTSTSVRWNKQGKMTSSWHGFDYIDFLRQLDRWVDAEGHGIARTFFQKGGNLSLLFFRLCNDENVVAI